MKSRLFEGAIVHYRRQPRKHRFRYRVFMVHLYLNELPQALDALPGWSARRPALAWFRRGDHTGDPGTPLADTIRERVRVETGRYPTGNISLLSHLRYFGYGMNPVSFYYCWDRTGQEVEFIVAEVNNTPWGEQHCYVLDCCAKQGSGARSFTFKKQFHVSPFMPMEQTYVWRFSDPGGQVGVTMQTYERGELIFSASMSMTAKALNRRNAAIVLLSYPFMTAQVILGIFWQAFRLWLKRVPFYPHPKHLKQSEVSS